MDSPYLIVGIGASAGGLEPLERFFAATPIDTGIAFVVVQHLSPDYPSLMNELLARHTTLEIHRVEDRMKVHANAIYLIPPRKNMVIENGVLRLSEQVREEEHPPLPIDIFFRSLAADQAEKAVAIVLSGTGTDGSRGVKAIKEAGGLVLIQDKDTAKFDGMPQAAKKTGVVAAEIEPSEMPSFLVSYIDDPQAIEDRTFDSEENLSGIDAVLGLLNKHHDIDFSLYKPSTVHRRIERRVLLGPDTTIDQYVERLRNDPDELNLLYKSMLIGVTEFFRDAAAYESLSHHVIPKIFEAKNPNEEIRVWVAGCASGEEAYSVGILLDEARRKLGRAEQPIRIFATDAHRTSVDFAASGRYSAESLGEVMPERLNGYFAAVGNEFQVAPYLRQMITFATQNMITDAPFTRMDLVTCRNVLIYFRRQVQTQVLSMLHFALNPSGTLFLGPSETTQPFREEFEAIDPHWRIYRKRRDVRLLSSARMPTRTPMLNLVTRSIPHVSAPTMVPDSRLLRVYDTLLRDAIDAAVLVNERRDVVHVFGQARDLLKMPTGRPVNDILSMLDNCLRPAVGTAIQKARLEEKPVNLGTVRIDDNSVVLVRAQPIVDTSEGREIYVLVRLDRDDRKKNTFELPVDAEGVEISFEMGGINEERIVLLEQELQYTKENLQTTIEELETSNEELNASNEELIASNEELQSTNEELHSVNEELHTVNAEYQQKITELTQMTDDMNNLLSSTEIGTLFLDRVLTVRRFTPSLSALMKIRHADIGRPLDEITPNFEYEDFLKDAADTLQTGNVNQAEVLIRNSNKSYLVRYNPYRLANGDIDGLVLTFIDISALRTAERLLLESEERFQLAATQTPLMIWMTDADGQMIWISDAWLKFVGHDLQSQLGEGWAGSIHPEDQERVKEAWVQTVQRRDRWDEEFRVLNYQDELRWTFATGMPRFDMSGNFAGHIGTVTDISDLRKAERDLYAAKERLQAFLDNSPAMAWAVDENDHFVMINPVFEAMVGIKAEDCIGRHPRDVFVHLNNERFARFIKQSDEMRQQVRQGKGPITFEIQMPVEDKTYELLVTKFAFSGSDGQQLIGATALDVTSLNRVQRDLLQASDRLNMALRSSNSGLWDWDIQTNETYFNDVFYTMLGYEPGELPMNMQTWQDLAHPDDLPIAMQRVEAYLSGESESYRFEHRLKCKDGSWKWVIDVGEVTERGESGQPTRMTGLHIDVHDLKMAEKALEELNLELEDRVRQRTAELVESEQRFQEVSDHAPLMIWMSSSKGENTWCNHGFREFTGLSSETLTTDGWMDNVHPDDREQTEASWIKTLENQTKWDCEFRLRDSDGTYRWMFTNAMPRYSRDQEFLGYIGTIADVTDRREAAEQLKLAHEELEQRVDCRTQELRLNVESLAARNRELDQFAHAASHDLRSPLRTILGFAEHLQRSLSDTFKKDADELDSLDRITSAAKRMSQLVDSLLLFATVGRGELSLDVINPDHLIEQILTDLAPEIEAAEANIRVESELPMIVGDPTMIRQLFQNLISNAIKYSRDDAVQVEISANQNEKEVTFSVSDNGTGLKSEDLERAFEPFQRLHPGNDSRGTGIGLSICRRVVDRHGGEIYGTSELGVGTTFTFTIPIRDLLKK